MIDNSTKVRLLTALCEVAGDASSMSCSSTPAKKRPVFGHPWCSQLVPYQAGSVVSTPSSFWINFEEEYTPPGKGGSWCPLDVLDMMTAVLTLVAGTCSFKPSIRMFREGLNPNSTGTCTTCVQPFAKDEVAVGEDGKLYVSNEDDNYSRPSTSATKWRGGITFNDVLRHIIDDKTCGVCQ